MFSVRPIQWLVCFTTIALLSGCGRNAAEVLAPTTAPRGSITSADRIGWTLEPGGITPCDPSYAGPVFTVHGPGLAFTYPIGGYCVCPEAEVPTNVPANRTVTFEWSADASGSCTNIRWYRWALDIEDIVDETPRINEATDLSHWSMRSLATSATVGPFAFGVPPGEHRLYIDTEDGLGFRSLAIIRITVVEAVNAPPDVQSATAALLDPGAPNGDFSSVRIDGVSDPDGDAVTITVTGVTQDEAVLGKGERPTCPDALIDGGVASVRRERSGTGNGRVYTIAFTARDANGGESAGTAEVCIPHGAPASTCVRDPLSVNSLEACELRVAGGR
jgi:hypothetical protein